MLRYYFYYEEFDQYRDAFKEKKQLKIGIKTGIEVYKTNRIKRFIFEFINVAQDEILK
jgi:hypothetical protein